MLKIQFSKTLKFCLPKSLVFLNHPSAQPQNQSWNSRKRGWGEGYVFGVFLLFFPFFSLPQKLASPLIRIFGDAAYIFKICKRVQIQFQWIPVINQDWSVFVSPIEKSFGLLLHHAQHSYWVQAFYPKSSNTSSPLFFLLISIFSLSSHSHQALTLYSPPLLPKQIKLCPSLRNCSLLTVLPGPLWLNILNASCLKT